MPNLLDKIQEAKYQFNKNFDFVNEFILDDCINLIKSYYISLVIYKKHIDEDDVTLIQSVSCCCERVYSENIQELFSKLYNLARENSKGACGIKRFLIQKDEYDKYFNPEDGKISFLGAEITPVLLDLNQYIIAICESKYKYIEPHKLVLLGKVKNAK